MTVVRDLANALARIFVETWRAARFVEFWVLMTCVGVVVASVGIIATTSPSWPLTAWLVLCESACMWVGIGAHEDLQRRLSRRG